MNSTQSIIVYRNPMEQAFWETVMNGQFFPVIAAIIVFFVVLLTAHNLLERFNRPRAWNSPVNGYVSLALGAVAAVVVGWMLWI